MRYALMTRMSAYGIVVLLLVMPLSGSTLSAQDDKPRPVSRTTVLDTAGCWRTFYVIRPPVTREDGKVKTVRMEAAHLNRSTAPPPTDWMSVDFNDVDWPRVTGIIRSGYTSFDTFVPHAALICRRGNIRWKSRFWIRKTSRSAVSRSAELESVW